MACRAGITTDLQRRKKEWEQKYPSMYGWTTKGPFQSREDAQKWEDEQWGCEKSGGGNDPDDPNAKWYAYKFHY